jgi:hypothetical protein
MSAKTRLCALSVLASLASAVGCGGDDQLPQPAPGKPRPADNYCPADVPHPGTGGQERGEARRRFLVFWCPNPRDLKNATHITPQVWVEGDASGKAKYPASHQRHWLDRGVTPLRWVGGFCYREKTEDDLVAHWSNPARMGFRGIAVDEFGYDGGGEVDRKMARALVRTRKQAPDLFIAVWQTRRLSAVLLKAFQEAADLVMVERYVAGTSALDKKFAPVIAQVGRAGILHKTVLALGINDRAKPEDRKRQGRWANSEEELAAQVRWIRRHAPEMPGVAFFAPAASPQLVRFADELAGRSFAKDE